MSSLSSWKNGQVPLSGPAPSPALLFGKEINRRRIFLWVLIAHVAAIVVPLTVCWIVQQVQQWIDEHTEKPLELTVMKVGLADMPEGNTLDIPEPKEPLPEAPVSPAPPPPAPEPDPPAPEPPKPQPPPPPKPEPPKPQPPPPPKPEPPKPQPPKPPEPPKPKFKALSAEDIKKQLEQNKNKKIVKKTDTKAEKAARDKANREYQKQLAAYNKQKAAYDAAMAEARYGVQNSGLKGVLATQEERDYYDKAKDFIDQRFVEPSASLLNGEKPVVKLELTIEADGRLSDCKITQGSSNAAMMQSVKSLIAKIAVMPKPPHRIKIPVTLRVK